MFSIVLVIAPWMAPLASAHHTGAYGSNAYGNSVDDRYDDAFGDPYSYDDGSWNDPYPYKNSHSYGMSNLLYQGIGAMPGFRCYYWGRDGSCMNYSYSQGPRAYPRADPYRHSSYYGYENAWDSEYPFYDHCDWNGCEW